jgi:twitching motility protein PilT
MTNFEQLLKFGADQGASAIHLQAQMSPQLRIGGLMRNVESAPISADELSAFIASIAPKSVTGDLERSLAAGANFSISAKGGRFRCTAYSHLAGPGLVLRVMPATIRTIEDLQLPKSVREVALASRGLILVVGPGGSGRSTTLAAMIDAINGASYQKIVTIEAPVEYLHTNKKAMITQMEIGQNATSYEHGLALALQQDADVIYLSDLREPEVIRKAVAAAESGRKILAGMIGQSAIQTLERLMAQLVPLEAEAAAPRLAAAFEGLIAQRLASTRDGKIRPAVEVLRGGPFASKAILENRLKDLTYLMEGRQGGMQSLDQHLIELHVAGVISGTEALRLANNPEAVGAGLRSYRQASAAQERTASEALDVSQVPPP